MPMRLIQPIRNLRNQCRQFFGANFTVVLGVGLGVGLGIGVSGSPLVAVADTPAAAPSPMATNASEPPTSSAPKVKLEVGESVVKTLVVGSEPVQRLRLKPRPGSKQEANLVWQIQTRSKVGDREIPIILPMLQSSFSTLVRDVAPNGNISYQVVYNNVQTAKTGAPADENVTQMIERELSMLAGMSGEFIVSERGEPQSISLTLPENMSPLQRSLFDQLSQSMTQLAVPLPDQPVGVGAEWRQTVPLMINGAKIEQVATYKLVSLKAQVATIAVQMSQMTANQKIDSGVRNVGDLELQSFVANGKGQIVWSLEQLMPQQSQLSLTAKMRMQPPSTNGAAKVTVETETTSDVTMTSN
jgi:hypothetical protein